MHAEVSGSGVHPRLDVRFKQFDRGDEEMSWLTPLVVRPYPGWARHNWPQCIARTTQRQAASRFVAACARIETDDGQVCAHGLPRDSETGGADSAETELSFWLPQLNRIPFRVGQATKPTVRVALLVNLN